MLIGVKLDEKLQELYSGTSYFGIIKGINRVNTFVGINNSGKSRFLRTLFSESKKVKFISGVGDDEVKEFMRYYNVCLKEIKRLEAYGITYKYKLSLQGFADRINRNQNDVLEKILDLYWYLSTLDKDEFEISKTVHSNLLPSTLIQIAPAIGNLSSLLGKIGKDASEYKKIYIPILRGLRPIASSNMVFSNENLYLNRTLHDYFKSDIPNGSIFTGLSIYESIKKLLLGDESERNEIKEFEKFLEENLFKKKINLIPKYDDDVLHIKIGDETQFPIYNLGDGLQTLIIILFPIFINRKDENLIFLEEPETHLHPKWQRLLYRAMCMFDKHTYFISTHSSIFINSPQNSIFIVSKQKEKTHIHYSDVKTDKISILKDLGYKPNDLYQTNYLLWVEGQSDKVYVNHLINKIDNSLIEGEDYSVMFYGGSSYKHFLMDKGDFNLGFIESLNQNYGLIMDSDRIKSGERYNPKKKEIVELFKKNKSYCWLSRLREIENYIPYEDFVNAVKFVHRVKNIKIDETPFGDRCKYEDLDANPGFKPSIKLSNDFFSKIQKNKDGSLRGIKATEIRKEIEGSISHTKKTLNSIDKLKVAERVVSKGFELNNEHLVKQITTLVDDIKRANS